MLHSVSLFDWHKGLLYKLKMYGIGGKVYICLKSYLANRTQRVMYKKFIFFYGTNSFRCISRLRTWTTTISNSCKCCNKFFVDCLLMITVCSIHQNVSNLFKIVNHDIFTFSVYFSLCLRKSATFNFL